MSGGQLTYGGITGINVDAGGGPTPISQPMGLVVTPDNGFLYVINQDVNTVSVFDLSDNTQIDTVPVGSSPFSLGITPDGQYIYVANQLDATTTVIRVLDDAIMATIPSANPYSYAFAPNSLHAYVLNLNGDITVIDVATQTVLTTTSIGGSASAMLMAPDGAHLYVGVFGSSVVSRIETVTYTVDATITGLGFFWAMAITLDSLRMYAIDQYQFRVVNLTTNVAGAPIALPFLDSTDNAAISPDGAHVFVVGTTANGRTAVIETVGNTVVADFFVGIPIATGTLVIAPDSSHYYFTNGFTTLFSIETVGFTLEASITLDGNSPYNTAIAPDGSKIYVALRNQSLVDIVKTSDNSVAPLSPVLVLGPFQEMSFPGADVTDLGGGEVQISAGSAVIFDPSFPHTNIRSKRDAQSPIDNTQVGITNLGTADGNFNPGALGAVQPYATISGGDDNEASAIGAVVGGGNGNTAGGEGYAAILGGDANTINGGTGGFIGGGSLNSISADYCVVAGGYNNAAGGGGASIGGGTNNGAGGAYAVIGGGQANDADDYATVGGGLGNFANGAWSTVPGGQSNQANGDNSLASGNAAISNRTGQRTHSSGDGGTGLTPTQESDLTMAAVTPGAGVGETAELLYGTGEFFQLNDDDGLSIVVTVVAKGDITGTPAARVWRKTIAARRSAGLTTIAAQQTNLTDPFGDAAAASWTLVVSVGVAPDRIAFTFTTGATMSAVAVTANLEFIELNNP